MAKYKVIKCELLKDVNECNYLKLELLNTHLMWEPTIAVPKTVLSNRSVS